VRPGGVQRRRRRKRRRRFPLSLLFFLFVLVAVAVGAFTGGGGRKRLPRSSSTPAAAGPAVRVPAGPIPGLLLIADRGNDRILLVDNRKRILWRYPPPAGPAYPFQFDDDAFFGPGFTTIVSNQEDQHTIQILGFPSGRLRWRYGHANVHGSGPGYLNTPDDSYQLHDGLVSVADAYNCRVLFIDRAHQVVRELGRTGSCAHDPPRTLAAVNGATPLPGGGTLVSEITGSWIDAFSPRGRLLWDFQAPVAYPSDPQWLGGGRILLADYTRPGRVLILDTGGRVLWQYGPASGPGMLDHPSLAMRIRPGLIAVNDDYRDRVVLIDTHTRRIVWQYGHTDAKGRGPGYLNTPDGMDLLPAGQALARPALRTLLEPPAADPRPSGTPAPPVLIRTAGFQLPAPVERTVAVAGQGRVLIAGGLDAAGQSVAGVFGLDPASGRLQSLGALPLPVHDAAGALIGGRLYVFGGGAATSSDAVQVFDPATRRGSLAARLPRPLSDLAAAQVGRATYLVGGFDGRTPRPEILVTRDGRHFTLAGRLPIGLRYPAVAAADGKLLIAGGQTATGLSAAVYAFDPVSGQTAPVARLPAPVAHAAAVVRASTLYILGGADIGGAPTGAITTVDLSTHAVAPLARTIAPRADAAAAQLGAATFLIGGRGAHTLATVLEIGGAR
jgi:outer membrane protein assembly factor BamB